MTGREFSGVDIDLLADYVGGALDGTPDEAAVTALIADDPAWRTAHDSLVAGMAAVGAELRALGAASPLMPDDVAARLGTALAGVDALADGPAQAGAPRPGRHLSVVPGGAPPASPRLVPAARRGLRRWAAPVAAAAGVLAFAGFGVEHLWGAGNVATQAGSAANRDAAEDTPMLAPAAPEAGQGTAGPDVAGPDVAGPAAAAAGVLAEAPPPESITTSDTDYSTTTLPGRAALLYSSSPDQERAPVRTESEREVSPGLQRLSGRDALAACLGAIAGELGTGPITVGAVEYARFAGVPAVIVRFAAADGEWVWASGAGCGLPGVGADTLHPVKVG